MLLRKSLQWSLQSSQGMQAFVDELVIVFIVWNVKAWTLDPKPNWNQHD